MNQKTFDKIERKAKKYFRLRSHDWSHVERVFKLCEIIGKKEKADMEILKTAALLHDIKKHEEYVTRKVNCHAEAAAREAVKILEKLNFPKEKTKQVAHCIEVHRLRTSKKPETLEARILRDADKIDSLGAIGIGRTIMTGVEYGKQSLHNPNIDLNKVKIEKIKDINKHTPIIEIYLRTNNILKYISTKTGKQIARKRIKFMKLFLKEFFKEWEGKE